MAAELLTGRGTVESGMKGNKSLLTFALLNYEKYAWSRNLIEIIVWYKLTLRDFKLILICR